MSTSIKPLAGALLLFNCAGAFYGGLNLIAHPDGSSLQMPLYHLQYTPFNDFLIPGIILLVVNGLFNLLAFYQLARGSQMYPWFVMAAGVLLTGWIVVQVFLIRSIGGLHITFFLVGILLFLCGWLLERPRKFVV